MKQIFLDSKNYVGGVCASQDWSQKNPLAKLIFFLKGNFAQRLPNSKKWFKV